MAKKELQTGQCYIISTDREENPKLGAKLLSDGRESLFLDFYFGYEMVYNNAKDEMQPKKQKRRESLKLYLWHNPEPHYSDRKIKIPCYWLRRLGTTRGRNS